MVNTMTINELIKKGLDILGEGDFSNPLLDVQLILCYTLNVDKIYIYTHKDHNVSSDFVDKFFNLINKRKEGYPLQYIIKKQEFMGLDFYVDEGVLVPRPDTEILVEAVIDNVKRGLFSNEDTIKIIDIGTGSGAITLSLAYYLKNAFVYSVDISDKALRIAEKNCENLNLKDRVKFLKGDTFKPLEGLGLDKKINIIVSNPPYIPSDEIPKLQREVSIYEPKIALDGGEDGLYYYRKIISESVKYLTPNGLLAFEIGYNQGNDVKELINKSGYFKDISAIKDLSGHDRVVVAYGKD